MKRCYNSWVYMTKQRDVSPFSCSHLLFAAVSQSQDRTEAQCNQQGFLQ